MKLENLTIENVPAHIVGAAIANSRPEEIAEALNFMTYIFRNGLEQENYVALLRAIAPHLNPDTRLVLTAIASKIWTQPVPE